MDTNGVSGIMSHVGHLQRTPELSQWIVKSFFLVIFKFHKMSQMSHQIDRKKPPPPGGGFLFTMFPHQEPCVRGTPSKDLYQVLRGGSSYTQFLTREHSK